MRGFGWPRNQRIREGGMGSNPSLSGGIHEDRLSSCNRGRLGRIRNKNLENLGGKKF